MNIQLIIVIVIGIAVGVVVLRELYKFFFVKKDTSRCGGCAGCDINYSAKDSGTR